MRIADRRKAVMFFVSLGVVLSCIAAALNVGWIILNWREELMLFLGVILFAVIIAGLILNTIFLVREIRRNEQQDSFLNAVTHELKTPITSIRLYLETLQRRPIEAARAQEFYGLMLADTGRLLNTVEQVLRAGELGHKRVLENALEVDVHELLVQSIELVRTRHHLPESALTLDPNAAAPTVLGNPDELKTVFTNVLDNAVKYSPPDSIAVSVSLSEEPREAEVRVRDNGRGIPPSDLKRVFKRFYRVTEPGQKMKGTGLGLFIVHSIVRKHGGTVWAESLGPGTGTTMVIRLPKVYAA
jgi:two-component system, OmpR family, sensor histidine kinase SenX3